MDFDELIFCDIGAIFFTLKFYSIAYFNFHVKRV